VQSEKSLTAWFQTLQVVGEVLESSVSNASGYMRSLGFKQFKVWDKSIPGGEKVLESLAESQTIQGGGHICSEPPSAQAVLEGKWCLRLSRRIESRGPLSPTINPKP
jgi:hypothetical protein